MQDNQDSHLGTGEYRPEAYWSARAKKSQGALFDAVCVFDVPDIENRSTDRYQRSLMAEAVKNTGLSSGSVMEFGCGGGRWCNFFQVRGFEWHGIDISEDMLAMAKDKNLQVDLRKTDGETIPHPDASFDLVYSITVIHHNPYESQLRILREMERVLKPGGTLILFEALGDGEVFNFNMFPRKLEDWISTVESLGLAIRWRRTARYWPIRDIVFKLLRVSPPQVGRNSLFRRAFGWLDFWFGMLLQKCIPKQKCTTAIMVFQKPISAG